MQVQGHAEPERGRRGGRDTDANTGDRRERFDDAHRATADQDGARADEAIEGGGRGSSQRPDAREGEDRVSHAPAESNDQEDVSAARRPRHDRGGALHVDSERRSARQRRTPTAVDRSRSDVGRDQQDAQPLLRVLSRRVSAGQVAGVPGSLPGVARRQVDVLQRREPSQRRLSAASALLHRDHRRQEGPADGRRPLHGHHMTDGGWLNTNSFDLISCDVLKPILLELSSFV